MGRLVEDHEKARSLAEGLAPLPGIELDTALVQTNIVRFRVTTISSFELVDRCHARGLHMLPAGKSGVRAVLHRDIAPDGVTQALSVLESALSQENKEVKRLIFERTASHRFDQIYTARPNIYRLTKTKNLRSISFVSSRTSRVLTSPQNNAICPLGSYA